MACLRRLKKKEEYQFISVKNVLLNYNKESGVTSFKRILRNRRENEVRRLELLRSILCVICQGVTVLFVSRKH